MLKYTCLPLTDMICLRMRGHWGRLPEHVGAQKPALCSTVNKIVCIVRTICIVAFGVELPLQHCYATLNIFI
jgi:hypothetical protein